MKLMYVTCCASLIVPHAQRRIARWCSCGSSAVWWEDVASGKLVTYSTRGREVVAIVGLHNDLLAEPVSSLGFVRRDRMRELIAASPVPLFSVLRSLVFKMSPDVNASCTFVDDPMLLPPRCELSATVAMKNAGVAALSDRAPTPISTRAAVDDRVRRGPGTARSLLDAPPPAQRRRRQRKRTRSTNMSKKWEHNQLSDEALEQVSGGVYHPDGGCTPTPPIVPTGEDTVDPPHDGGTAGNS